MSSSVGCGWSPSQNQIQALNKRCAIDNFNDFPEDELIVQFKQNKGNSGANFVIRAQIVDILASRYRYKVHANIVISSLLPLVSMSQVACSHTSASTKHRVGWDSNTGHTGTVAQSDKSTTHIHLMM